MFFFCNGFFPYSKNYCRGIRFRYQKSLEGYNSLLFVAQSEGGGIKAEVRDVTLRRRLVSHD